MWCIASIHICIERRNIYYTFVSQIELFVNIITTISWQFPAFFISHNLLQLGKEIALKIGVSLSREKIIQEI